MVNVFITFSILHTFRVKQPAVRVNFISGDAAVVTSFEYFMSKRQKLVRQRVTILFGIITVFILIFLVINYGQFFTEKELSPLVLPVENEFDLPYESSTGLTYDGENIWVSSPEARVIASLDPETGEITDSFTSPGYSPWGLAWDGEYLWVVDYSTLKLYKIDTESKEVVFNMTSPGVTPAGLTYDGESLYVSDFFTERIYKIDPETGTVHATQRTPDPGKKPSGLAWDGENIWIADVSVSFLFRVDPDSWEVVSRHYSSGYFPGDIAWDGEHLWVLDFSQNKLYETAPGEIETLRVRVTVPTWYWTMLFLVALPTVISIVGALSSKEEPDVFFEGKKVSSKKLGLPLIANVLGIVGSIYTSYELLRLIYSLAILKNSIIIDFDIFWLYRVEMLLSLYTLLYWIYYSVLKLYSFYAVHLAKK